MGKGLNQYQRQLKLILKQIFNDKNNIDGRREIMNRRIKLDNYLKATQDQLRCEKTKAEEL